MLDVVLGIAQVAIAAFVGWRAAHSKFECDLDTPLPLWHWGVEIALELAVSSAPADKRCDRELRERQDTIYHLPSPTVGKGRTIVT